MNKKMIAMMSAVLFSCTGVLTGCSQTSSQSQSDTSAPTASEQPAETTAPAALETPEEIATLLDISTDPKDDPFYEEKYGYYADLAAEYEAHGRIESALDENYYKISLSSEGGYGTDGHSYSYRNGTVSIFFTKTKQVAAFEYQTTGSIYTFDLETRKSQTRSLDWWRDDTDIKSMFDGKVVAYLKAKQIKEYKDGQINIIEKPDELYVFDMYDESFEYRVGAADLGYSEEVYFNEYNFFHAIEGTIVLPNGALLLQMFYRTSREDIVENDFRYYSPEEGVKFYTIPTEIQSKDELNLEIISAAGSKVYVYNNKDYQVYYLDLQTGKWSKLKYEALLESSTGTPGYKVYGKYMIIGGGSDKNYSYKAYSLIDLETAKSVAELHYPYSSNLDSTVYCGGESHFFAGYSMQGMIPGNGAVIDKYTKKIVRDDSEIGSITPLNEKMFIIRGNESDTLMKDTEGNETKYNTWYIGTYENGVSSLQALWHINS